MWARSFTDQIFQCGLIFSGANDLQKLKTLPSRCGGRTLTNNLTNNHETAVHF